MEGRAALKGAVDDGAACRRRRQAGDPYQGRATWRDKCLNFRAVRKQPNLRRPASPSAGAASSAHNDRHPPSGRADDTADVDGERTDRRARARRRFKSIELDAAARRSSRPLPRGIDFRASCQYDAACLAQDVLAAVRYLRESAAKTVAVVGASLGGGAAAQAAIDAPDKINRIVLIAHMTVDVPEKIRVPALFILARDDANASGPRLPGIRAQYEKASGPKELVLLDGSSARAVRLRHPAGRRMMREIVRFVSQY